MRLKDSIVVEAGMRGVMAYSVGVIGYAVIGTIRGLGVRHWVR